MITANTFIRKVKEISKRKTNTGFNSGIDAFSSEERIVISASFHAAAYYTTGLTYDEFNSFISILFNIDRKKPANMLERTFSYSLIKQYIIPRVLNHTNLLDIE